MVKILKNKIRPFYCTECHRIKNATTNHEDCFVDSCYCQLPGRMIGWRFFDPGKSKQGQLSYNIFVNGKRLVEPGLIVFNNYQCDFKGKNLGALNCVACEPITYYVDAVSPEAALKLLNGIFHIEGRALIGEI